MIHSREKSLPRAARWGWGILLAISGLLTLNGAMLYFFVADSQLMRTVSILESGSGLLALGLAWEGFRHGSRWARNVLWILVLLLATVGVHILFGGEPAVSIWYFSLAAVALLGQLLAGKVQI